MYTVSIQGPLQALNPLQTISNFNLFLKCMCYIALKTLLKCYFIDIDECSTGVHNCTQNQQCVNSLGTFSCECNSGYELLNGTCEGTLT